MIDLLSGTKYGNFGTVGGSAYPAIANCDFNEIIDYLKQWEGQDMNDSFPYEWIVMILDVLYFIAWIVFLTLSYFLFHLWFYVYISIAL